MSVPRVALDRYRGPEYRRLLTAARKSLERTGGQLTGRISVVDPDDAERRAIIGITGVHQPAGTKRMTVRLADLDTALDRATGLNLADLLAALGEPLRNRPAAAATLAAARIALAEAAEGSPLNQTTPWYRTWPTSAIGRPWIRRSASWNTWPPDPLIRRPSPCPRWPPA